MRILVDRLWPRGLRKDAAVLDHGRKDLSPSTELRTFYGHRPERYAEFVKRYLAELRRKDATTAVFSGPRTQPTPPGHAVDGVA